MYKSRNCQWKILKGPIWAPLIEPFWLWSSAGHTDYTLIFQKGTLSVCQGTVPIKVSCVQVLIVFDPAGHILQSPSMLWNCPISTKIIYMYIILRYSKFFIFFLCHNMRQYLFGFDSILISCFCVLIEFVFALVANEIQFAISFLKTSYVIIWRVLLLWDKGIKQRL